MPVPKDRHSDEEMLKGTLDRMMLRTLAGEEATADGSTQ